jgi:hypothetical protein
MRVWTKSAVVVVAASTVLTAQSTPQAPSASRPARDTPAQTDRTAPQPTGRITGRVLASDTGRPVRRARVLLNASELPGGRGVLTDDNGLFDFIELRRSLQPVFQRAIRRHLACSGTAAPPHHRSWPTVDDPRHRFRLPPGSVIASRVFDEAAIRRLERPSASFSTGLAKAAATRRLRSTNRRPRRAPRGLNPRYYVTAVARNFTPGRRTGQWPIRRPLAYPSPTSEAPAPEDAGMRQSKPGTPPPISPG